VNRAHRLLTVPADGAETAKLAKRYPNEALGEIAVTRPGGVTTFDFGEWKSEVASKKNPDGTVSFVTTVPGMTGIEFVVGSGPSRTLITRDARTSMSSPSSKDGARLTGESRPQAVAIPSLYRSGGSHQPACLV
jgi:hypothetical protein